MIEQAAIYIPENRPAWWGGLDKRPRCAHCGKVVFPSQERAEASAAKAAARETRQGGKVMQAYLGKCGHWHVGHGRKKELAESCGCRLGSLGENLARSHQPSMERSMTRMLPRLLALPLMALATLFDLILTPIVRLFDFLTTPSLTTPDGRVFRATREVRFLQDAVHRWAQPVLMQGPNDDDDDEGDGDLDNGLGQTGTRRRN